MNNFNNFINKIGNSPVPQAMLNGFNNIGAGVSNIAQGAQRVGGAIGNAVGKYGPAVGVGTPAQMGSYYGGIANNIGKAIGGKKAAMAGKMVKGAKQSAQQTVMPNQQQTPQNLGAATQAANIGQRMGGGIGGFIQNQRNIQNY